MTLAPLLLTTTFLTAPVAAPSVAAPVAPVTAQAGPGSSRTANTQPHQFGLGAAFGPGVHGAGLATRWWFAQYVGLDTRVVFSSRIATNGASNGVSIEGQPSAIVMLNKADPTTNVNFRPYVGAGLNFTHAGADALSGTDAASGHGYQAFGGMEIQIRSADSFAICGEVSYYHRSAAVAAATSGNGTTFLIVALLYK